MIVVQIIEHQQPGKEKENVLSMEESGRLGGPNVIL